MDVYDLSLACFEFLHSTIMIFIIRQQLIFHINHNPKMISEDPRVSVLLWCRTLPEVCWDPHAKYTGSQGHRRGQPSPSNLGVKSIRRILRCQKPEIQPIWLENNYRFYTPNIPRISCSVAIWDLPLGHLLKQYPLWQDLGTSHAITPNRKYTASGRMCLVFLLIAGDIHALNMGKSWGFLHWQVSILYSHTSYMV